MASGISSKTGDVPPQNQASELQNETTASTAAAPPAKSYLSSFFLSALPMHGVRRARINAQLSTQSEHGRAYFATPEHHELGDSIHLNWPSSTTPTTFTRLPASSPECHFPFQTLDPSLNNLTISYGTINAMAGDYYGTYSPISSGLTPPDRTARFLDAFHLLTRESGSVAEVAAIQNVDNVVEVDPLRCPTKRGEQPSEIASHIDSIDLTKRFYDVTCNRTTAHGYSDDYPSYLGLIMTNYDHFGADAVLTYKTGHTAALELAANAKGDVKKLKLAYAMNAFADHFLEDLFSAGHVRTPRRVLHNQELDLRDVGWEGLVKRFGDAKLDVMTGLELAGWGISHPLEAARLATELPLADLCSGLMHNEDSALGVWVTNRKNPDLRWKCIGDDYLDDKPSGNDGILNQTSQPNLTKTICLQAIQASADEIHKAFITHSCIPETEFEAFEYIPIVHEKQDLAPLFRVNKDTGKVERRVDVDNRIDFENYVGDYWGGFLMLRTVVACKFGGRWEYPLKLEA